MTAEHTLQSPGSRGPARREGLLLSNAERCVKMSEERRDTRTPGDDAMSKQKAALLAWVLVALTVMLLSGSVILDLAGVAGWELTGAFTLVFGLVFSGVGAVIAIRQPGNAIGWIFILAGVAAGSQASPARMPIIGSPAMAGRRRSARPRPRTRTSPGSRSSCCPRPSSCCSFPMVACSRRSGAGRLVRGSRHRRCVRDERIDSRADRGLSAAREPLRRRQPAARSAHRA